MEDAPDTAGRNAVGLSGEWMKIRLCATALALAACVSSAQAADGARDVRTDAIRGHVWFLSDDALEGRATATRGHELAAAYVASQLAAYGLKPAGDQGSWYQTVPLLESAPVVPAATARLERAGKITELVNTEDFLPRVSFTESDVTLSGPLTFVGYGVHAPELGYDDFAGVDLKGRIAVILNGAPPAFPVDQRAYYSSAQTKGSELAARGAIGVLTLGAPVEDQAATWERRVLQSWIPGMRWVAADGKPVDTFPELRGGLLISPQGAKKLFAGAPHTLEEVFVLAQVSRPQSFELPGTIVFTAKSQLTPRTSMNVVGVLQGSDPRLQSEYIVVSAHLDHLGKGPEVNGDAIYNGALDNASGTALLLESARVLAHRAGKIKRSIVFIAVTGEEKGLLGSDYFVQFPTVPRSGIVADINIDMPVALTTYGDIVAFGAEHSTLGEFAKDAAAEEHLIISPDLMPEEVRFIRSDQYSFVRHGIPAIMIDVGSQSVHKGVDGYDLVAQFRRSRYHMPGDDRYQSIDYDFLATLARVNVHMAYAIANARTRPRWNAGDFFGKKFGDAR
jgi:Zn-dependent M28 family amino/carboxypeptidase